MLSSRKLDQYSEATDSQLGRFIQRVGEAPFLPEARRSGSRFILRASGRASSSETAPTGSLLVEANHFKGFAQTLLSITTSMPQQIVNGSEAFVLLGDRINGLEPLLASVVSGEEEELSKSISALRTKREKVIGVDENFSVNSVKKITLAYMSGGRPSGIAAHVETGSQLLSLDGTSFDGGVWLDPEQSGTVETLKTRAQVNDVVWAAAAMRRLGIIGEKVAAFKGAPLEYENWHDPPMLEPDPDPERISRSLTYDPGPQ